MLLSVSLCKLAYLKIHYLIDRTKLDNEENFSYSHCCDTHGYTEKELVNDAQGQKVGEVCSSGKVGKDQGRQYFLCGRPDHEGFGRSVDDYFSSKEKWTARDITRLNYYTAIYCPRFLPNSCASDSVMYRYIFFYLKIDSFI